MATTEYLYDQEIEHVLRLLTRENRLAMRVALNTGMRISDVLSLETKDLKPSGWYTEGKTGKRRRLGLPGDLLEELESIAGRKYVFEGRSDWRKHRTRQAVWTDVHRAAKALRMDRTVGTHSARKVYAVNLLRKYGNLAKVQRNLNHSSSSITAVYAMADQLLERRLEQRKVRAGKRRRARY